MLTSLRERKLLVPSLMVAAALPILMALGFWQLERKAWKDGLIASIESRVSAPAVPFASLVDAGGALLKPPQDLEYTNVRAEGRFLHDQEMYLYAPDPIEGPGVEVITPFVLASSGATVLVDRGYVPDRLRDPSLRAEGRPHGTVEIAALVRSVGEPGAFTPPRDPRTGLWFWRDFDAMIAAAGAATPEKTVRVFLDATEPAVGGWPRGRATRVALPNRHLEYALTWFGLAAALLAVFAVYAVSRLRERAAP